MTRPRQGIKDVASAAGVSLTTVSDALSGKGRLPPETRLRVQEVAERLGYRPSALARGLRARQVGILGFVLVPATAASISTVHYWTQLMTTAAESAMERGYALVLLPPDLQTLTPLRFPVDGVIVVDPLREDQVLATLRRQKLALVTVGRDLAGGPEPWVDDDQSAGALQLLRAIASPGDRVALITLPSQKSYLQDTVAGINLWGGHAAGFPSINIVDSLEDQVIDAVVAKLMAHQLPDLILGANDRITLSIHRALKSSGFRVPSDVRLASLVDAPELELANPAITAAVQHPRISADKAVASIVDLISGVIPPSTTLIPVDLEIRDSARRVRAPRTRRPKPSASART